MIAAATKQRRRLLSHRAEGLLALGFNLSQTLELSTCNDVVREAQALLERGWPHDFVVEELVYRKEGS